jgi:hypothetical protein
VIVANDKGKVEFNEASDRLGSDICTTGVIAEIFSKYFFTPIRVTEARFNRYLRNDEYPMTEYLMRGGPVAQVTLGTPGDLR